MYWRHLKYFAIAASTLLMVHAAADVAIASPGIEIIPIAVWQGKSARQWNTDLFESLRETYPKERFAHAVSAARLIVPSDDQNEFRFRVSQVMRPGDDVLLHVAPWKTIADSAGAQTKLGPTLFGTPMVPDDCIQDCGLELSVSAFSHSEIRSMVRFSSSVLADRGFGSVRAVYFDQGVVSSAERGAAMTGDISEDWSGVEMGQMKTNLGRFPVWQWNEQNINSLNINDAGIEMRDHQRLDHVRFGIHAEIADLESSEVIIGRAIETSKRENRVTRLPIVFNVEDLIHTHGFVSEAIARAHQLAANAGVPEISWTTLNTKWDIDKIKPQAATLATAPGEAEFLSNEEMSALQFKLGDIPLEAPPVRDKVEIKSIAH